MSKAFTLIELMFLLVAISIILAAYMSIVTKKAKFDANAVKQEGKIKYHCEDKWGVECELCYKEGCILCKKNCNDNEILDIKNCACVPCREANCEICSELRCTRCVPGYYFNKNFECIICPAGYKCDGVQAIKCPRGTYQDSLGQTDCMNCNNGKYQDNEGQSICKDCTPGTYTDGEDTARISCEVCPAGTYNKSSGSSLCITCPENSYCKGGDVIESCSEKGCLTCDGRNGRCTSCIHGKIITSNGECIDDKI